MAKLTGNSILQGVRGTLGNQLVVRKVGRQTIISVKPQASKKSTPAQKATRGKFKEATIFAKAQMNIPERKEYYRKKAKKLSLPNAYTAAITDYMRGIEIEETKVIKERGVRKLKIEAGKRGFEVKEVKVILKTKEGATIDVFSAQGKSNHWWWAVPELKLDEDIYAEVRVYDNGNNFAAREMVL